MHSASEYASVGQYIIIHACLQNQKNSTEVRGAGHDETNTRVSLD